MTILSKDGIILLGVLILHFVTNKTELGRPSVLGKMATAATFVPASAGPTVPCSERLACVALVRATGGGRPGKSTCLRLSS